MELSAPASDDQGWRLDDFPLVRAVVEVTTDEAWFDAVDGRLTVHLSMSTDGR